jgi:transposase
MMDLSSRMHLAYGSSMKSEKQAFDRAMEMLSTI